MQPPSIMRDELMLETFTQPYNLPFAVSLGVLVLLAMLQFVGLADIMGADADTEIAADGDMGVDAGLLSLIGLGRIPFMMWLMLLLGAFGVIGLAGQELLAALTGAPWSPWLVAPAAGLAALPVTGAICRPLGRILPEDETTAIEVASLVGREAEIVIGIASPGNPARGRVTDRFGQTHYVMLEPDNSDQRFVEGETVLLVRHEGDLFKAISRGDHYLPRLDRL